ncbi:DEAD/DEAH box helicase [Novosphingobium mathurense]|uniref:Superfamily II DNA or RNA helicase n=1 Tax=Novosphingobium mathurense TaxID=428990 RepID=A0A1U6I7A1_9SPHN|nr:DEAD/DEAH box helicase [Novosphingobium mathurense]SLK03908.1 Superfamily II DNA or RNA helicase [Novosphingobium mathurense]
MIQLREYQARVIEESRAAYAQRLRAVLLCMPTGAGKTMTASTIVHGASAKGNVTWWLVHRRELLSQASQTFHSLNIPHGTVQAGHVSNPYARVQVASVQTIIRRLDELPAPDLIVFDEAHHIGSASWQAIFEHFPHARVLGLTATPWRLDGVGLGNWFEHMVLGPTTGELIEQGSLSRYRLFAPAMPDLSGVGTVAGDFHRSALSAAMDKPQIVGDAIGHYKRLCAGKRAVAFAAGVENSKHIAAQFIAAGIPAEHVDGSMSVAERDGAVERFRSGQTLILSNADLFGEGFDVPAIEAAILLRPTKSLSLHLQQVGRALRPAEGKSEAIILDHAGNSLLHGLPDDAREWDLADREKKKRAAPSEVPVRTCEECYFVYRPAPKCPQCGHAVEVKAREIEVVDGVLEEVKKAEPRAKFREQGKANSLDALIELGRQRGYKNPTFWARKVWASRQGRRAA